MYQEDFQQFLQQNCDRKQFILDILSDFGIKGHILSLDNTAHIIVRFPHDAYNPQFRMKTVLVHYDRVPGSPGANDNSAAVFQVLYWARRLLRFPGSHNVKIIFSDGEEMGNSEGVSEQGAFGIASKFRQLGLTNEDIYVFDCCGRGDVFVLSKAGSGRGSPVFQRQFNSLIHRTEDLLRRVSPNRWLTLPVPYSDNAGFLACGIPAVAITVLPSSEAVTYMRNLQRIPGLEASIMKGTLPKNAKPLEPYEVQEKMPATWRLLHTEYDNISSLTPQTNALMEKLLDSLAHLRTPIW
ncbi:MAG: M28 family peptidase [Candidatus Treponema excrementipullorum]|nr:M28 family peptidase [Candidatus Treponema excrementipullorum]